MGRWAHAVGLLAGLAWCGVTWCGVLACFLGSLHLGWVGEFG